MQLEDKEYEERLIRFLKKHYEGTILPLEDAKDLWPEEAPDEAEEQETLVLTDREMEEEEKKILRKRVLDVIVMSPDAQLDPYQSGHGIVLAIMELAKEARKRRQREEDRLLLEDNESKTPKWLSVTEEDPSETERERKKGKILSIGSMSGGLGVTSAAMAFAKIRGEFGRTLFLDLSWPSEWPIFFSLEGSEGGMGELLFSFLAEPGERFDQRIEEFVCQQPNGLFFIRPVKDPNWLTELTEEECEEFIRRLTAHFDYTIADVSSAAGSFRRAVVRLSSDVCLLTDGSDVAEEKRKRAEPVTDFGRVWTILRVKEKEPGNSLNLKKWKSPKADIELPWEEILLTEKNDRRGIEMKEIKEDTEFFRRIREAVNLMG